MQYYVKCVIIHLAFLYKRISSNRKYHNKRRDNMGIFESKEEKEARIKHDQEAERIRFQERRAEDERKRQQEKQQRIDSFMKDLEKQLENKIITLALSGYEGNELKQEAMNYLVDKGYVCVQNNISATQYTLHFALTFVKAEQSSFFITK